MCESHCCLSDKKIRIEISRCSGNYAYISITSNYLDVTSIDWKLLDIDFQKIIIGKICIIKLLDKTFEEHKLISIGGSFDNRGDDLTNYIGTKDTGMGIFIGHEYKSNGKSEVILVSTIITSFFMYALLGNIQRNSK